MILYVWVFWISILHAKDCSISSCEAVKSYREQKYKESQWLYRAEGEAEGASSTHENKFCTGCTDLQFQSMLMSGLSLKKKIPMDQGTLDRIKIIHSAEKLIAVSQEKKKLDLKEISHFYEENKIDHSISEKDLEAAYRSFVSHIREVESGLKQRSKKDRSLQEWIKTLDLRNIFSGGTFNGEFYRLKTYLRKNKGNTFELLEKLANAKDEGMSVTGNSPYFARMMLLFHAKNEVSSQKSSKEKLNRLARKLHHKMMHPPQGKNAWDSFVPHDGYLYGAHTYMAQNTVASTKKVSATSGLDCSLFVQKTLEDSGTLKKGKVPRLTTHFLMHNPGWKREKVCGEEGLEPGDVVFRKGHTFIFGGYGIHPVKKTIEPFVYEATDGRSHSLRKAWKDLYSDLDKNCKKPDFGGDGPFYKISFAGK